MKTALCQHRNAPDAACRATTPAFCHRCQRETPTIYLPLSSGDIGNVCGICRTCRRGHPYVTRREYEQSLTPVAPAEGERHETATI